MILRNGKIIKHNIITFSDNIQLKYYILSTYEKLEKKKHYNNIKIFNYNK